MSEAELVKRLDRLERENRLFKRVGLGALAAIGAVLLMGQTAPVPQTIRARRFVLEDARGRPAAELAVFHDNQGTGPGLRLFDATGNAVVYLDELGGGRLRMGDAKDNIVVGPFVGISASQGNEGSWSIGRQLTGLGMLFTNRASNKSLTFLLNSPGVGTGTGPGLTLADGKENQLSLLTGEYGSKVFLYDAEGFSAEIGNTNLTLPSGGTYHTPAASIELERNDTVIWQAPPQ